VLPTWQVSFKTSKHTDDPFCTGFSKYADMTGSQWTIRSL